MGQSSASARLASLHTAPRPTFIADLVVRTALWIVEWEFQRRTARDLADLDDHLLRDVGLTREAAEREMRRYRF